MGQEDLESPLLLKGTKSSSDFDAAKKQTSAINPIRRMKFELSKNNYESLKGDDFESKFYENADDVGGALLLANGGSGCVMMVDVYCDRKEQNNNEDLLCSSKEVDVVTHSPTSVTNIQCEERRDELSLRDDVVKSCDKAASKHNSSSSGSSSAAMPFDERRDDSALKQSAIAGELVNDDHDHERKKSTIKSIEPVVSLETVSLASIPSTLEQQVSLKSLLNVDGSKDQLEEVQNGTMIPVAAVVTDNTEKVNFDTNVSVDNFNDVEPGNTSPLQNTFLHLNGRSVDKVYSDYPCLPNFQQFLAKISPYILHDDVEDVQNDNSSRENNFDASMLSSSSDNMNVEVYLNLNSEVCLLSPSQVPNVTHVQKIYASETLEESDTVTRCHSLQEQKILFNSCEKQKDELPQDSLDMKDNYRGIRGLTNTYPISNSLSNNIHYNATKVKAVLADKVKAADAVTQCHSLQEQKILFNPSEKQKDLLPQDSLDMKDNNYNSYPISNSLSNNIQYIAPKIETVLADKVKAGKVISFKMARHLFTARLISKIVSRRKPRQVKGGPIKPKLHTAGMSQKDLQRSWSFKESEWSMDEEHGITNGVFERNTYIEFRKFGKAKSVTQLVQGPVYLSEDPGSIIINVSASSVNVFDCLIRQGVCDDLKPLPITPGVAVVGEIRYCGHQASSKFKTGEKVAAICLHIGGNKKFCTINSKYAIHVSPDLDSSEVVSILTSYSVAYRCLFRTGRLKWGDTLLLLNGDNQIGAAAIQLAKFIGASSIYVTGSSRFKSQIENLGAIFVSQKERLPERSVNLVFDTSLCMNDKNLLASCGDIECEFEHAVLTTFQSKTSNRLVEGFGRMMNQFECSGNNFVENGSFPVISNIDVLELIRNSNSESFQNDIFYLLKLLKARRLNPLISTRIALSGVRREHERFDIVGRFRHIGEIVCLPQYSTKDLRNLSKQQMKTGLYPLRMKKSWGTSKAIHKKCKSTGQDSTMHRVKGIHNKSTNKKDIRRKQMSQNQKRSRRDKREMDDEQHSFGSTAWPDLALLEKSLFLCNNPMELIPEENNYELDDDDKSTYSSDDDAGCNYPLHGFF